MTTVKLNRDCQLGHDTPTPATWDAKHISGPWAYMCDNCFKLHAHPGYAAAATRLEREDDIEVFEAPEGVIKGSKKYFELAIAAGFFGCDDAQTHAFRKVSA